MSNSICKHCSEHANEHGAIAGHTFESADDPINPNHYKSHPSGIECIEVTRHYSFNIGNVIKYLWRAGLKNNGDADKARLEDYEKARWYLDDEIVQLEKRLGGKRK